MKIGQHLMGWVAGFMAMCWGAAASAQDALPVQGAPRPWQLNLQPPKSPLAEQMFGFHTELLVVITVVTLFVLALLVYVCWRFRESANPVPSKTSHNTTIEIIWTAVPVIILLVIFVPSMRLLYAANSYEDAEMTVKVTGHQWYWSYSYPDHGDFAFDSIMIPEDEIDPAQGQIRLLSVDEPLVLPVGTKIRFILTSADVLHNFAVSSLGVRMDTVPGRLNESWTQINEPGRYFGFCSELCGTGHAYMPIEIHALPKEEFEAWVEQAREKFAAADMPARVELAAGPVLGQ